MGVQLVLLKCLKFLGVQTFGMFEILGCTDIQMLYLHLREQTWITV